MLTAATTRWRIPTSLPRLRPIDPTKLRSSEFCLPKTDHAPRWPPIPPPISPSHLIETATTRSPNLHKRPRWPAVQRTPLIDTPGRSLSGAGGSEHAEAEGVVGFCEVFRMTAPSRDWPRALGPSSESLQGRNPREVGGNGAARSMGISTRLLRMRLLMRLPAERWRSRTVVATRLGSPGKRRPTPIRALRGRLDTRSDER
jgi:hypothetical protein